MIGLISIIFFNPLLHEFFFSLVLEIEPKLGSYRLPTRRRSDHRKFFDYPLI